MPGNRLSYPDFRNKLLFAFALVVEGDFEKRALATDAAKLVEGRHQASWIETAAASLAEDDLLRARSAPPPNDQFSIYATSSTVDRLREMGNSSGIQPNHYSLTEKGYYEASRIGRQSGRDLEEEMDALVASGQLDPSTSEVLRDSTVTIEIDTNSPDIEHVESALNDAIAKVGASNTLMDDQEGSQRHAELKAGKALLSGKRLDVRLFKSTVLPALKWLASKVTDESASMAIQAAIAAIVGWIMAHGG